jgi:uncharacterized protein (DUF362 family)
VAGAAAGSWLWGRDEGGLRSAVVIARAASYQIDLARPIVAGLAELGIGPAEVRGRRVLLKPNLVEPSSGAGHVNTHPLLVRGAVEAFLRLGARRVLVGEGQGHRRDALLVLDESGLAEVLAEDRIRYVDLNHDAVYTRPNAGSGAPLATLSFPQTLREVDWIVSLPKLKTHHYAGATLAMKNLFGVMPGLVYGWPKNVLHWAGIERSIFDITATLRPHLAIADGIVGMEGDGPILGTPREAGVVVMGRNLPAVDATCCRVMGIDPLRLPYLAAASGRLGPVREPHVQQRGEPIAAVRTDFELVAGIPAFEGIRLG